MTMMSSLKAFLFASPAQGAMTGAGAVPTAGGDDFAALLGGMAKEPAAPDASGALPMPAPVVPVPTEGEARALPSVAENAVSTAIPASLPAAGPLPGVMAAPAAPISPVVESDAETDESTDAPEEQPDSADGARATAPDASQPVFPITVPIVPMAAPLPPAPPIATASPARTPDKGHRTVSLDSAAALPPASGLPGTPVASVPASATSAARMMAAQAQMQMQMPSAILAEGPAVRPVGTEMEGAGSPAPVPSILSLQVQVVPLPDPIQSPPVNGKVAKAAMAGGTPLNAPVRSEALNLLQMVREQFAGDTGTAHGARDAAAKMTDSVTNDSQPAPSTPAPIAATPPSITSGPVQATPLSVDLGGTITGQVVDMGVKGQWIDGLAKDIANLSVDGAQGRFQIRSDHLGAVQVDIRPGDAGASVSLTVASEAARQALQADGDRLIADAALSAMKIADVRVERGTIQEAAQADSMRHQQQGSQGHNQSQTQNSAQSQNGSQDMGQNRSGQRDNFSGNHKAGSQTAVLPQAESREGEATGARRVARRDRYA